MTVSPILGPDGELVGASTIARDITERRRADQLVRLAVEAAPSGMLMANREGEIIMVNSKIEEIFGYPRDSLIGHRIESLIPSRLRAGHPEKFQQFIRNPGVRAMGEGRVLAGLTRDGREVPIEIGLTPVHTERGIHVLAAVVDITERRRMVSQLRAKTAEMEQLLYAVSHDLKSPLVTVEGFAALMSRHLDAGSHEKAKDAASRVQRGAKTMGRLIEDILELSRLSNRELSCELLDLPKVLEEVLESLEVPMRQVGAQVQVVDPFPREIFADHGQLVRALLNLIGNALKYGCPAPSSTVWVGGEVDAQETRVYVRDEGPGIEGAHQARIFELFQRLSVDADGTGLGLASVTKAMERHGGRAWVESEPGQGATFWLAVPIAECQRVPSPVAICIGEEA